MTQKTHIFTQMMTFTMSGTCYRMVICPVGATYNHVVVFFLKEKKTAFELANIATFAIAKSVICFKFHISLIKIHVFSPMVTCTISGKCHHDVNLFR